MRRATLLAVVAALCLAGSAQANVTTTEEPNFTRGTSNTWWFNWSDPGAPTIYRICFSLSANGGASVSQGCTGNLRGQGSGQQKITVSNLAPGSSYVMCATERYDSPGLEDQGDLPHVTACESSAMDTEKPLVSASINGTDETTSDPRLQLHINYADSQSPPWFYFDAFNFSQAAAVYGCFAVGGPCTPEITDEFLLAGCGTKNNGNSSRVNSMDCTADWPGPDGKIYFCARVADSALADRPDQGNQLAGQTPAEANVSDVGNGCGFITLSRGGSGLAASAPSKVRRGKRLTVKASAPGAGRLQATLTRKGKAVTGKRIDASGPGTYKLRLRIPAKAKPGRYKLKVLFTGGGSRSSRTLNLKVLR